MATAHLIHGYLGAGKTTFARRLEKDLPAVRFTHDEWMARLYGDDPPVDEFPAVYGRVSEQIDKLWPRCLELGLDVVLDLNFWSRRQRDETRAAALALGASIRLCSFSQRSLAGFFRLSRVALVTPCVTE
jgi:predicted kinase